MADFSSSSRAVSLRAVVLDDTGETRIAPGEILSFSLSEGVTDGKLLGCVLSSFCTLTTTSRPAPGARIFMEIGLKNDPDSWQALCAFYVRQVRVSRGSVQVTGSSLSDLWGNKCAMTPSPAPDIGTLAQALARQAGMTLSDPSFPGSAFPIAQAPDYAGMTLRDALGDALCAAGCFAIPAPDGSLRAAPVYSHGAPKEIVHALDKASCDSAGMIENVVLRNQNGEQETLSVRQNPVIAQNNTLTITGSRMLAQARTRAALSPLLLTALAGKPLVCARVTAPGDPAIQVGDNAIVSGSTFPVTMRTLDYHDGAMLMTYLSDAPQNVPVSRVVTPLDGACITAGTIPGSAMQDASVTGEKLAAGAVTADKILQGAVTITCLNPDVAGALDLSSNHSVVARVLDNSSVSIAENGVFVRGAQVMMATDQFSVTALENNLPTLSISPSGVRAGKILCDRLISPSVVQVSTGAAEFCGSVGASVRNIGRYLAGNVTLTVPGGRYQEEVLIEGLCGAGTFYLMFSADAILDGGVTITGCTCPVVISGGTVIGSDTCMVIRNCSLVTLSCMTLFGAERQGDRKTRSAVDILASRVIIENTDISRADICITSRMGSSVRTDTLTGGTQGALQMTCTSSTIIRSAPSDTYQRTGTVARGAVVTVLNPSLLDGRFYQIRSGEQEGYVLASTFSAPCVPEGAAQTAANLDLFADTDALSNLDIIGSIPCAALETRENQTPSPSPVPVSVNAEQFRAIRVMTLRAPVDEAPQEHLGVMQGTYAAFADEGGIRTAVTVTCRGAWILENASALQGKNIRAASLTVRRSADGAGTKTLCLMGHAGADTGMPALFPLGLSIPLEPGQETTIPLPESVCAMLRSGEIKGFGAQGNEFLTMTEECRLTIW